VKKVILVKMASFLFLASAAVALRPLVGHEPQRPGRCEAAARAAVARGNVEHFDVDGTTLLRWTITVQTPNQQKTLEETQRIAG
jgi:hypothetical protein